MIRRRATVLAAALALGVCLLAPTVARAGQPTEQLKASVDELIQVLKDPALKGPDKKKERRDKLRRIVQNRFDFTEMSARALATHWRKRTPQEKKEFTRLFRTLLERRYIGKIEQYQNERIKYVKEDVDGDFATIDTRVVSPQQPQQEAITIDYDMLKTDDGKWLVYDVVVENVRLVKTYRDQFNSILSRSSYDDLVKKLEAMQDKD